MITRAAMRQDRIVVRRPHSSEDVDFKAGCCNENKGDLSKPGNRSTMADVSGGAGNWRCTRIRRGAA
jgi:hypothetical protein